MLFRLQRGLASILHALIVLTLLIVCTRQVSGQAFSSSGLSGESLNNPTSLQFGPDGRLYVSQQDGYLFAYTVTRNGPNNYSVTDSETIDLVRNIPNHNDDGSTSGTTGRQVTALLVTGTPTNPVLYVTSSDPRIGAGGGGSDSNLDTNSGILSRLTWTGSNWEKVDLVRGLPRSEENHASNGMQIDKTAGVLYLAQGGHTNAGSPSNNFAFLNEYALSGAILSIDLNTIEAMPTQGSGNTAYKYDLPTLNDPDRSGNPDSGDPFGGNDGLNQARLVPGGPVQIYSPGFRNPFDVVLTTAGRLYTVDNGANGGWGGHPDGEGSTTCTNKYLTGEPGSTSTGPGGDPPVNNLDNLHFISGPGYYGGHPNPVRGNPTGAGLYTFGLSGVWRTSTGGANPLPSDWPPASASNSVECDFRQPGVADGALYTWTASTNGIAEYTASNFSGGMAGDLLTASYSGDVFRIELNGTGDVATNVTSVASGFGAIPLDVTAQGDADPFPGTIWAATYGSDNITIFEPTDFGSCTGVYDIGLDEDSDGYSNADEIDNATNPCSAASKPDDNDGDFVSDLNDPDDDDDGLPDTSDPFAIDAANGASTPVPILLPLFNNDPGTGFFGVGFTGMMSNGSSDYLDLLDPNEDVIGGGTSGLFTIPQVGPGDAYGGLNTQVNAFQFGFASTTATGRYTIQARLLPPLFDGQSPADDQSHGIYMGTGDQDNYLKIAAAAIGGSGGIEVIHEVSGIPERWVFDVPAVLAANSSLDLRLSVDPAAGLVRLRYAVDGAEPITVGEPILLVGSLKTAVQSSPGVAAGLIATSRNSGAPFAATWDFVNVTLDPDIGDGSWTTLSPSNNAEARHENAFVEAGAKLFLLGGRGSKPVQIYDPAANSWVTGADPPVEMHHFQAILYNYDIYVVAGYSGACCSSEFGLDRIYIYDIETDSWSQGAQIPSGRRRGSTGTVLHEGKIYLAGGLNGGHGAPATSFRFFDMYDPVSDTWTVLPDMPRDRDHFHAVILDGELYAAGGRDSSDPSIFDATIGEVDVFDFGSNSWTTLPGSSNLPTLRGGCTSVVLGDQLLVIGGESGGQTVAHAEVEAFDPISGDWNTLPSLIQGRHGTQAAILNGEVYIAAGSANQGGGPELDSIERYRITSQPNTPPVLAPVGNKSVVIDDSLVITVTATDADPGDTIALSASNLPPHASFVDLGDGSSTLKLKPVSGDEGSYPGVVFTVYDGAASDEETITVTYLPAGGTGPFLESDGRVVFEAEHFESSVDRGSHAWEVSTTETGYSDEAAMASLPNSGTNNDTGYTTTSPELVYEVDFITTGTYYVWVRGWASDGSSNSVHSGLDGTGPATADRISIETFNTWQWGRTTMDTPPATLDVTSIGQHSIHLWMREDGFVVDKVILTTDETFTPAGEGPAESPRFNLAPTAAFSATPLSGGVPLLVDFDASASSDPEGPIVAYDWDFGDGNSASGITTSHTYTTSGSFEVRLTVSDERGLTADSSTTIYVNTPPVLAGIGDQHVIVGRALDVVVSAADDDPGDILTLTPSNLPPSASFEDLGGGNGILRLRPLSQDEGTYAGVEIERFRRDLVRQRNFHGVLRPGA